jgi:hypothetical protein
VGRSWVVLTPTSYVLARISRRAVHTFSGKKRIKPIFIFTKYGLDSLLRDGGGESDILQQEKGDDQENLRLLRSTRNRSWFPFQTQTVVPAVHDLEEATALLWKKGYFLHTGLQRIRY